MDDDGNFRNAAATGITAGSLDIYNSIFRFLHPVFFIVLRSFYALAG